MTRVKPAPAGFCQTSINAGGTLRVFGLRYHSVIASTNYINLCRIHGYTI